MSRTERVGSRERQAARPAAGAPEVRDVDCVAFLQWALPHLRLRWAGFRKVRGQIRKRIARRLQELELLSLDEYRQHLGEGSAEWARLDAMCRVTISRFYRDRGAFDFLSRTVLPELIRGSGERGVRCWSAGCASGEEPYTLALAWHLQVGQPDLPCTILATDSDQHVLERARRGIYDPSSLRDLPQEWRRFGFVSVGGQYRLRAAVRDRVTFACADVRASTPQGPFDLILCRNLVLTYFEPALQREVLSRMTGTLAPEGALAIGIHERLPSGVPELVAWNERAGVYRLA